MRKAFLFAMLVFLTAFPALGAERGFLSGYTGTLPAASGDLARTYFNRPEVRRLLAALETGPVSEAAATQSFAGTDTQLADLIRLRLVRSDRGLLRLGFAYFTAADVAMIHQVAAKYVPSLVAAYKAKSDEFDAIFARYRVASVPRERLAFVLLAGFSLNWDALKLLEEQKYRAPVLVRGPDWHYSFWASEDVPNYSYKGYYWGSNTFPAGGQNLTPPLDFSFSSFGDPLSDPRMNFPDLFTLTNDQFTPSVKAAADKLGLRDETYMGTDMKQIVGMSRMREVGAMLFAMRAGADTRDAICAALDPADLNDCDGALGLLVVTGYISQTDDGRYQLLVPVFDTRDKTMLDAALGISRKITADWLTQNYAPMRRELFRLTAVRQGVPYPALFTQIWHELFGLTTRELVEQGVIEDPYAEGAASPGSIPAVWRATIYHFDWE